LLWKIVWSSAFRRSPQDRLKAELQTRFSSSRCAGLRTDILKNVYELQVSMRNLRHRVRARNLLRPQVDEPVPETGPAYSATDEAFNASRRRQPFAHLPVVFASAQNDEPNFVSATASGRGHNLLAVLAAVEPFDLPYVRFDARVLQLANGPNHQAWA